MQAALRGAKEIGFTVLSMSTSLVAVFIPILLMGGIVGRLFREFSVTLSIAIAVSLVVSLTTTPMMSARFLRPESERRHGAFYRVTERFFSWLLGSYEDTLSWVLEHPPLVLLVTVATIGFTIFLYVVVPKGFFPQQDTGRLSGSIVGDQDISFQAMRQKMSQFIGIVISDPAVDTVAGFTGGGTANRGNMFISLKPLAERKVSADTVINRLRPKLARIPAATLFLQAQQDVRVGGRSSNSQYQYTLRADSLDNLTTWSQRLLDQIRTIPEIRDANSDLQSRGLQLKLVVDRDSASRLGLTTW
jgi:multidrug efflux pump